MSLIYRSMRYSQKTDLIAYQQGTKVQGQLPRLCGRLWCALLILVIQYRCWAMRLLHWLRLAWLDMPSIDDHMSHIQTTPTPAKKSSTLSSESPPKSSSPKSSVSSSNSSSDDTSKVQSFSGALHSHE